MHSKCLLPCSEDLFPVALSSIEHSSASKQLLLPEFFSSELYRFFFILCIFLSFLFIFSLFFTLASLSLFSLNSNSYSSTSFLSDNAWTCKPIKIRILQTSSVYTCTPGSHYISFPSLFSYFRLLVPYRVVEIANWRCPALTPDSLLLLLALHLFLPVLIPVQKHHL